MAESAALADICNSSLWLHVRCLAYPATGRLQFLGWMYSFHKAEVAWVTICKCSWGSCLTGHIKGSRGAAVVGVNKIVLTGCLVRVDGGIDFHINNFTALSVGDILPVLSPPSGLVKLIIWKSITVSLHRYPYATWQHGNTAKHVLELAVRF